MKKKCPNCKTIVKCDKTVIDEVKGYGIICDVCGAFFSIRKEYKSSPTYHTHPRCPNCKTIVKCDKTVIDEIKGYGIICDICGAFFSTRKEYKSSPTYHTHPYYQSKKQELEKKKIRKTVIMLIIIGILGIVIGTNMSNSLTPFSFNEDQPIVKGEVINIQYWNITSEKVSESLFTPYINVTRIYGNLTIDDQISNELVFYNFEIFIIQGYNIHIGSIIWIFNYGPYPEIEVY